MRGLLYRENGFALVFVLFVSFISFFIVLSVLTPLIQHRQLLDYRLGQLQAEQLVKNGVVHLQEISFYETMDISSQYIGTYPIGQYTTKITSLDEENIQAIIIGETNKGYRQSYDVILNKITHQVSFFVKRGGG